MKLTNIHLLTNLPESSNIDKDLANRMMSFLHRRKALGLAANQVGYTDRLFVMDVNVPRRCWNPKILWEANLINTQYMEGCLSYPKQRLIKPRSTFILASYLDQNARQIEVELFAEEAICYAHELDHLNGVHWLKAGQQPQTLV